MVNSPKTPPPEHPLPWGGRLLVDRGPVALVALLVGLLNGRAVLQTGALPGSADIPVDGAHGLFLFQVVANRLRGEGPLGRLVEVWHPVGRPLGLAIQNAVDASLSAPLLWIFGPARGLSLFTALMMASNALAGGWLGRVVGGSPAAAFAGAVTLGFCPFAWDEVEFGRTTQAWLAPMALALGYAWKCAEPQGVPSRSRSGVAAGLALALSGYAYWFYGLFVAPLVLAVVLGRSGLREGGARLLPLVGTAAACVLPFVAWVSLAWSEVPGSGEAAGRFAVGAEYLAGLPWSASRASVYVPHGLWILALLALRVRPRRAAVVLSLATLCLAIFSLGRSIELAGYRFWLPYAWLQELPGLRRFWWPNRAIAAVTVGLLPLVALQLGRLRGRYLAIGVLGLLISVAQCIRAPGLPGVWTAPATGSWTAALPEGAVLVLPMTQPEAGKRALAMQPSHGRSLVNGMSMWERYLWPAEWTAWLAGQPLVEAILAVEHGKDGVATTDGVRRLAGAGVVGIVVESVWIQSRVPGWDPTVLPRLLNPVLGEPRCPAGETQCWWALPGGAGGR